MELNRKGQSLQLVFLKYLLSVALGLAVSAGLALFLFTMAYRLNGIVPADATEQFILRNKAKIAQAEPFDPTLIPENVGYVYLADDGRLLASNMSAVERKKAMAFLRGQVMSTSSSAYMEIERREGVVVAHYTLKPRYSNPWMEAHFPPVNYLFSALMVSLCFISAMTITLIWARRLTKQLMPMIEASEEIAKQNLDFEIGTSTIKEFNGVLNAFEKMKIALSRSLREKWTEEANRKNQISSLAHDLKTPVAIIHGNAELLKETKLSDEQRSYVDFIAKNSTRISTYAHALMEVNQFGVSEELDLKRLHISVVAEKIAALAREIANTYRCPIEESLDVGNSYVSVDLKQLERGVQNLLMNAIHYAPEASAVELLISTGENTLEITVGDRGPGFSDEDLKRASEPFYRGDKSRHSSTHYGVGLYTAKTVAELHHGSLRLTNRSSGQGAMVTLMLPLENNE